MQKRAKFLKRFQSFFLLNIYANFKVTLEDRKYFHRRVCLVEVYQYTFGLYKVPRPGSLKTILKYEKRIMLSFCKLDNFLRFN